jgi:hypothetical protein
MRASPVVLLAAVVGLSLSGCSNGSNGQVPATPESPGSSQSAAEVPAGATPIAFRPVEELGPYRSSSGLQQRQRVVVQEPQAWEALWSTLTSRQSQAPARPSVDFSRERLVVVSMGERPSGGYAIEVDGVFLSGGTLYVSVQEVSPGSDCMTTAALTQPVAAVAVPAGREPVKFVERTKVQSCSSP